MIEKGKEENLNKYHCRQCFKILLLGLKYTSNGEILIQEICENNHKYQTNLEQFLDKYKSSKITCFKCKIDINPFYNNFCSNCINYFCDKCVQFHNYHNPNHKIKKTKNNNTNEKCENHNQDFCAYCLDCPVHFCLYCKENHTNHKIFNFFEEIISKEEIENYKKLIENNEQKIKEFKVNISQIIKQLRNQVENIIKGLENFQKLNEYELELANDVLKMYEKSNNISSLNYEIIQNLKNILRFNNCFDNFTEIKKSYSLNEKIQKITLFLQNTENYLLKESSIDNKFLQIYNENKNTKNNKASNKFFQEMKHFKILQMHENEVYCLTILKDGRLASSSKDTTILIYESINFTVDIKIKEHTESVYYLTQLKDERLLSCSNDKTMLIIKLNGKDYNIEQILYGHSLGIIKAIQLRNEDIVSSSIDNTIKIWKENKNDNLFNCQTTISVHSNNIHSILEIPITNELVSSSNQEKTLRFFNLITFENSFTIYNISPCGFMGVLFLINYNILAVGTTDGLSLINVIERKEIIKMKKSPIYSFFRLKSGSLLTGEGKSIQEWKHDKNKREIHKGNVTSFAQFDNGILATCSLDKSIILHQ